MRVVPEEDARGCAFEGPGVDLVGDAAREAMMHAAPIVRWLEEREPGVVLRSISMDLRTGRVLATLDATPKPRVLRIDAPASAVLVECASPLLEYLGHAVRGPLERRG